MTPARLAAPDHATDDAALHPLGGTAVVTGAASGIGRALARAFDARGYRVALCDVDEAGLDETARGLKQPLVARVDVADRAAVSAFAARVHAEQGAVAVVVNNAGVDVAAPLSSVDRADFEWLMGVNFWGVVNGTEAFLPDMLKRRRGSVVNISSVFGLVGWPDHGTYCAAKFAVRGYTEALRAELAGTGVRAHCVHPGGIQTSIVKNSRFRRQSGAATKDDAVAGFDRVARTSPEKAARVIVNGVVRGNERILIGPDARVIDWLSRLVPKQASAWLRRGG